MNNIPKGYKQTKVGLIPQEWEVVRLGDVGNIVGGGTPDTTKKEYWNGNIFWFTPTEIKEKYINKSIRTISKKGLKHSSAKLLPKYTLLLTTRATIGDVGIALNECTTNQGFQSIIVNKDNSYMFIYFWILNNKKEFIKRASGSTFLEINKKEVEKIKIPLPPLKEQQKIAKILTTWDSAISKQEELIKEKEKLKKGLMQKLLSGEVRFKEFSDEWEEVRLGEIGEFKTSSVNKIIDKNEQIVNLVNYMDVYRYKHIDKNFQCLKTSIKKENITKVNLKKGDVLFTPSSETPDDIGHSSVVMEDLENTVYSYHLIRFRPQKDLNIKFSGYVFNNASILKEFAKKATGSTRFTLSIKDFNETIAQLPSLQEQQKIADVLSTADREIELLKKELERLKKQKKGLMQRLLTGEVRVWNY
jgi:type I restriction enzyme S subunit